MELIQLHGLVPHGTVQRTIAPPHCLHQCGRLAAIVSPFADLRKFEDLNEQAMAVWAQMHNSILQAYCTVVPVLPMAPGAVFSGTAALNYQVMQNETTHTASLRELMLVGEYTVSLTIETPQVEAVQPITTGAGFLRSKQTARDSRLFGQRKRRDIATNIIERLHKCADQIVKIGADDTQKLINAAILVPHVNVPALRQIAQELGSIAAASGLVLNITGPNAPYSYKPADHTRSKHDS